MPVAHDQYLAALSVVVAIQASFVALRLARRLDEVSGARRRALLAASALTLATGIWTMHFIGMLAVRLPMPFDYAVLPTLISFLVCVLFTGIALLMAGLWPLTWVNLPASALVMGGGILAMHYTGMAALRGAAHVGHDWRFVMLSALVGMSASGLALWLAFGQARRPPLIVGASAMGFAISGVHYVAMAGVSVHAIADAAHPSAPALSAGFLAILLSLIAFLVSGLFILTFVPERPVMPATSPDLAAALPMQGPADQPAAAAAPVEPPRPAGTIAVHRDGALHALPVEAIAAVHANAHYSFVSSGPARLFSPLSITEAEAMLPPDRFMRVHRSHIVNLDRVAGLRKTVDSAVVMIRDQGHGPIPVSRARLAELKRRLAERRTTAH
jgi:NO-binding membrane sensor protein with MHYT domain